MKKIRKRKVMLLMDDEYYDGDDAGIELAYRWHCFVIGGVKSLHNQRGRIYKCRPIALSHAVGTREVSFLSRLTQVL